MWEAFISKVISLPSESQRQVLTICQCCIEEVTLNSVTRTQICPRLLDEGDLIGPAGSVLLVYILHSCKEVLV